MLVLPTATVIRYSNTYRQELAFRGEERCCRTCDDDFDAQTGDEK